MVNWTGSCWMRHALHLAKKASHHCEVPVGAILVQGEKMIASAYNKMHAMQNPLNHAELQVISEGARVLGIYGLRACDLYVTLEPCAMCAGAIQLAGLRRLYFGAYDPKMGAIEHHGRILKHSGTECIGGMCEHESSILLKKFFIDMRRKNSQTFC